MQDVHSINGGRLLLRRINHHQPPEQQGNDSNNYDLLHHQTHHHHQPPPPALKCPRCDSLNTKFCYYNNYNLSQPRHFCKNCRRYWTKGGVLRNVPVGGGCRKSSKRSSSSVKSNCVSTKKIAPASHSSSENSSTPPAVGGGALFHIPEVENFGMAADIEPPLVDIGGFMNLMSDNNNENINNGNGKENENSVTGAETASFTEYLQNEQGVQEWDMGKICGVQQEEDKIGGTIDLVVDQTVRIEDLLQNRMGNMGYATLDWHLTAGNNNNNNNDQGLYDVADHSTVDHQVYWSQSTSAAHHLDHQWSDSTTSHLPLFLP